MFFHNARRIQLLASPLLRRRHLSTSTSEASAAAAQFASFVAATSSAYQLYVSSSTDPYLNLSVEHYLLQKTHPDATVLFLYANRPCVVIGRNQNPWLESNLAELSLPATDGEDTRPERRNISRSIDAPPGRVELVRRRSGGGAVFHGPGNVNYSVISPAGGFERQRHAQMVADALRELNSSVRVNERHDIVLSPGSALALASAAGAATVAAEESPQALPAEASPSDPSAASSDSTAPRKISGSAFKLTRTRALHHGTCLLCSPHLDSLSRWLHSPAQGFLEARGVDSVRSRVSNVLSPALQSEELSENLSTFYALVLRSFASLYPAASLSKPDIQALVEAAGSSRPPAAPLVLHSSTVAGVLGDHLASLPSVREGMAELRSVAWLFGQTPRFTLSTHPRGPVPEDEGTGKDIADGANLASRARLYLSARGNLISDASLLMPGGNAAPQGQVKEQLESTDAATSGDEPPEGSLGAVLKGRHLTSMTAQQWSEALRATTTTTQGHEHPDIQAKDEAAAWFARMLPLPRSRSAEEDETVGGRAEAEAGR